MFDYTAVIISGPPGYCDVDKERFSIASEDDLDKALREALRGYTHIRNVKVYCDQDPEQRNPCEFRMCKVAGIQVSNTLKSVACNLYF